MHPLLAVAEKQMLSTRGGSIQSVSLHSSNVTHDSFLRVGSEQCEDSIDALVPRVFDDERKCAFSAFELRCHKKDTQSLRLGLDIGNDAVESRRYVGVKSNQHLTSAKPSRFIDD